MVLRFLLLQRTRIVMRVASCLWYQMQCSECWRIDVRYLYRRHRAIGGDNRSLSVQGKSVRDQHALLLIILTAGCLPQA